MMTKDAGRKIKAFQQSGQRFNLYVKSLSKTRSRFGINNDLPVMFMGHPLFEDPAIGDTLTIDVRPA